MPFWVGEPELAPQRRIRVRYIGPPNAPLWLGDDVDGPSSVPEAPTESVDVTGAGYAAE